MANHNGQLDTTIQIVTPENIAFQYRLAGPFRRLPAYLLDMLIAVGVAVAAFFILLLGTSMAGMPGLGFGGFLVVLFILDWLYDPFFETFWNGQTPGKRLMKIRVISIDGQPITAAQALLRNILRAVDCQPVLLYQAGLVAASMSHRFQRLGDLVCGTMVVIDEPKWYLGVIRIADAEVVRMAEQLPAGFQASRTLARALANYVQRRGHFSWQRRIEIARHLADPLAVRFGLPPGTNPDLLLCALYYRTFITDRYGAAPMTAGSPFQLPVQQGAAVDMR